MAENKGFNIHNIHIYRKYTRYYFESKVTNQLICFIVGTTHFLVMLLFVKRIQVCIFWIKLLLHVYWHLHTFSYKKYFYNAVLTFLWFCIKNINHGNVSWVKLNGLIFFSFRRTFSQRKQNLAAKKIQQFMRQSKTKWVSQFYNYLSWLKKVLL